MDTLDFQSEVTVENNISNRQENQSQDIMNSPKNDESQRKLMQPRIQKNSHYRKLERNFFLKYKSVKNSRQAHLNEDM